MTHKVYTVFDIKSKRYHIPSFIPTKGEAIRGFAELCNNPETNFYKYPEDFTLFEIGTYDEHSGKIESHLTPVSCGVAIEYKKL